MKLEYLHDMTSSGKFKDVVSENLIRLWDFDTKQSSLFFNLLSDFINNDQQLILNLGAINFIEPVNCNLTLMKDDINNGINRINEDLFVCNLDKEGFQHMLKLIEPFTRSIEGYQWLDEKASHSNIDFLYSPGGTW